MINNTERDEREYLEEIKEKLQLALRRIDDTVKQYSTELRQNKEYIYEHQSGMDDADMVAAGQSINRMAFTGESAVAQKRKLLKLGVSPYFGRIDFKPDTVAQGAAVYIGIYTFSDDRAGVNLIYDWRAPVSSMFYDFELGEGWYETPSGKITGQIELKRQYRIRDGKMEFMIENSVNIQDDVLQKELSRSANERMKTIVATIQRDQNAVIRNETSPVMIIQGVAGSGKTSIAMHRIAFLLYRFRETIKSTDILIISPNKVFADYISNVLPELGEEHIAEMVMEELAADLLENKYPFQTFFEQVTALLERNDPAFVDRIKFKSSFEFLSKLNQYMIHAENNYFDAKEIHVTGIVVPYPFILERFKASHRLPMLKRFPAVIKDVVDYVRTQTSRKMSGHDKTQIWQAIPRMFRMSSVYEMYRDFYKWIGKEELFRTGHNGQLEYADVFPFIYLKIRLEGIQAYDHVKHLLVDEMQDYTAVQYAVLSRIFRCKKTILGDVSQTVNPFSASRLEDIERVFPQGDIIRLFRSYRSTFEITAFAQNISRNPDIIALERHGPVPEVQRYESNAQEIAAIRNRLEAFDSSGHESLAIICKTRRQAESLHKILGSKEIHLLTSDSTAFKTGIVLTMVHLVKGLEFDEVIIPFASSEIYQSELDRSLLYIACTRAMHQLTITCVGKPSSFLDFRQAQ